MTAHRGKPGAPHGRAGDPPGSERAQTRPAITSAELLGERSEVVIDHKGMQYRLKVTRQGKLILNK